MPATLTPESAALPVLLDTRETAALLRCSPKTLDLDRVRRRWRVPVPWLQPLAASTGPPRRPGSEPWCNLTHFLHGQIDQGF